MTFLTLIRSVDQRASEIFSEMIAEHEIDISMRGAVLLSTIADKTGASQTSLVEATGIDRSTLADMVRRYVKKGLIARTRTRTDARMYAVKLTDAGRQLMPIIKQTLNSVETRLTGEFAGLDGVRIRHPKTGKVAA